MKASLFFFILLLGLSSCMTSHNHQMEEMPDSTYRDSIFVQGISPFPDTMLPSTEKLMFVIDTFDWETPGELSDMDDLYEDSPGIFTFRGSLSRNPNFYGRLHGDSINFSVEWSFSTATDTTHTHHGVWGGGTGWTGQPIYVQWPDSIQEIIIASLCGKVYFLDFNTGEPTRPAYNANNVLKGTPSFNPGFNGDLYVGHGVPKQKPFGHFIYDLDKGEETFTFGKDRSAWRSWGAYDSSPVIVGGFLFRPGENGTVYKFHVADDTLILHSTLRYSTSQRKRSPGIESSMAVCRNYGYFNDNAGNVICLNLNTLKPVWRYYNYDDSDASPVIEIEDEIPYLYSGCEIDRQGQEGVSHFVKLNGLTGEVIWEDTIRGRRLHVDDKWLDGGLYGSPLLGGGDCSDMVFGNFCINTSTVKGSFVAFDKNDGTILYQTTIQQYSWSSPVAFYNDNDEMFIFTGDSAGYVYLIKGKTGEIVASARIGSNFESSPIIVDDKIILGSRGNKIYKIALE